MDNSTNTARMEYPTQLSEEENNMSNRQHNLTREREVQDIYTENALGNVIGKNRRGNERHPN